VTPDVFPEPAPDPTSARVDSSTVDDVVDSPPLLPTDGSSPADQPAEQEEVDPSHQAMSSADVSFIDVLSAEVPTAGDVSSADVSSADVSFGDVSSVDVSTADNDLSGDAASGDAVTGDVPATDAQATEVPSGDGPSADAASADVSFADGAIVDAQTATAELVEEVKAEPDPVLVDSVELARAAAMEVGGDDVGEHLGVSTEDAHAVTHAFVATLAGYRGWHWAVTVARSPQSSVVTVDEVVLLPGDGALRAPEWVPWSQRVRAGDLGAGDLLPADPDDARLVPSYFSDGDPALDADDAEQAQMRAVADEIGLGRVRVMSRDGRVDAAQRWFEADFGPDAPMAKQAPAHCGTCGFLVALSGSLGAAFGICANELSAADAHVVAVEFGCGAHSEAGVDLSNRVEPAGSVYDSGELVMESTESTPGHDGAVQVEDV
jgi:Protein of unknown function (DUF3027)